ncbi:MAG: M23 family metallopeptidase [bacterium]
MNPQTLKMIVAAFSMKKEIKLIFFTVAIICMLPILLVIMISQAGINLVSNVIATVNPQTFLVEIHDPTNGSIVDTISQPRVWPINGPVTADFGETHLPWSLLHSGIDIASPTHQIGDPIMAFMDGKVIYAAETPEGLGRHVIIDHGHHMLSYYGHMDTISAIVGQEATMGTVLGTRGSTGWSTGPHLHFQVMIFGIPVNPRLFLEGNP